MRQVTITKEDLLKEFTTEWKCLSPITRFIKLPYYIGRNYVKELVAEGKLESKKFNALTKYRLPLPAESQEAKVEAAQTPIQFEDSSTIG